jgi:hypothetical protein
VSAAGEDPELTAGRVSVISSIGYCAFLAGLPAIGFLGAHVTVLQALLAVAAVLPSPLSVATWWRAIPNPPT